MEDRMNDRVDIVVIGAGLSGLAFSRFYLDIHPEAKIAVLDADTHVGGVWSASRNFERFWSQSGARMSGFSDVEFKIPPDAPSFWDTYPARHITDYLESYVTSHVYAGTTLRDRIRLERNVVNVERIESSIDASNPVGSKWRVSSMLRSGELEIINAAKLVVAIGHTSIPNMPNLTGQDAFPNPVLNHKDFGQFSQADGAEYERADSRTQHVVVLGGGKSAADMAYDAVKRGKARVSWVIRRTNSEGPALFFPAMAHGRYRNSVEHAATRYAQLFSPSSFAPVNHPLMELLHKTKRGQTYAAKKRAVGRNACISLPRYQDRENALPGFKYLQPDGVHPFWYTGPLGLAQHDDFWDTLAQEVHIRRKDVTKLTPDGKVVLEDGEVIQADVILCGTGWKAEYPFLSEELKRDFGLPHPVAHDTPECTERWEFLLAAADEKVLSRFPVLAFPPPGFRQPVDARLTTTMRMYNCIAPLDGPDGLSGDQSVAILGHPDISNSFRAAEAQAIWATAYLDGNLAASGGIPSAQEADERVAYTAAFSRRRYPSHGARGDCIFFELLWYTDHLLQELGLRSHRASNGLLDDWLEPCVALDYKNMPDEYRRRFKMAERTEMY